MQLHSRPNICTLLRMFFTRSAPLLLFFLILGDIFPARAATITLVQHTSKDAGISSSSSLSFPANNAAGDWIAVCIRAGKSGQTLTVKDSNGNTYRTAFQFNVTADTPNGETVAIFYAENIAGGANTVTVTESISSNTLRFAILEYSGVATANSLDFAAGAQGSSASPNSGNVTSTANGDLLLGVAVTANGATYAQGSGFVIEDRVPSAPNTKLITESQIQSTAGAASASASLGASDIWGAALAAFKASSAGSLPPSITSLNPTSGPVGTSVTITGSNFGSTQGASTVTFNGTSALPTAWSATSITVPVPAGATTGNVVVTVGGLPSNGVNFTVSVFSVSVMPTTMSLPAGFSTIFTATVQNDVQNKGVNWSLSGSGCSGTACGTLYATSSPTTTGYTAPQNVPSLPTVTLTATSVADPTKSASAAITISPVPTITSLSPTSGQVGTNVTITGTNFGATQGASLVSFNGVLATPSNWGVTSIVVPVPTGASSGNVVVTVGGAASNGVAFTILPTPSISTLSPAYGPVGASVTITGANFGTIQGASTVSFNGVLAAPSSWGTYTIVVPVPLGASSGNVVVTVGGIASNGVSFTVIPTPSITGLSPAFGPIGTVITITGTNFGASQGTSAVTFNGTTAMPTSWSAASIVVPVPAGASTGNVVVGVNSVVSNGVSFTVTPVTITNITPSAGRVYAPVTITGTNFGPTQGNNTVTFNGTPATVQSWSQSGITALVPLAATSGNVVVTVGGVATNGVPFTVMPVSVSVTPTTATLSVSGSGGSAPFAATVTNDPNSTGVTWSLSSPGGCAGISCGLLVNGANLAVTYIAPSSLPSSPTVTLTAASNTDPTKTSTATIALVQTPAPTLSSLSPASGPSGTSVTITGAGFGATQVASAVSFGSTTAVVTSWSDTSIVAVVPSFSGGSGTVVVQLRVNGLYSNVLNFGFLAAPSISSLNPGSGQVGSTVTITGTNFGSVQGPSTVTFNGATAAPTSWSDTSITVPVPTNATTGNVIVTVGGQVSNGSAFTVTAPAAGIKLVQHASKDAGITTSSSLAFPANNTAGNCIAVCIRAGKAGQVITVSDSRGNMYHQAVLFNMTVDSDTLGVFYAENIAGGANTVSVADTISTGTLRFAILEYSGIASSNSLDGSAAAQGVSAAPNSGNVPTTANGDLILGTILTANPATFTAGSGFLIEATAPAEPNSKVMVEDGVQSLAGPVSAVASLASSDSWGAAIAAFKSAGGGAGGGPTIASLSPTSGPAGTAVTITGTNFGSSQGSSTVTFNGTLAAPTSWSATSIGVPVPAGATTGNVVVAVGGIQSNGVSFITGPISVTISPTTPTVAAGTTQSLTASVQNDPSSLGVSWSLSGTGCIGAACGTLSSMTPTSVVYTAPNPAPNPATVSVVATSVTDNTKSATATVTIGPPPPIAVSVSPATSTVSINLTQLFSATLQNDSSNQGVTWMLSGTGCTATACGTLTNPTSKGNTFGITYTAPSAVPAPATVIIAGTSVANSTKSGSSTVTISQGIPTSLGWYQIPNTLLQPVCPNIPQIQGAIGCQGVIAAWNGGIADTTRNRLLFTGGGHQNYWGNEVYSLNLSDLTLTRINNPVFPSSIPSCTEDWGNPPTVPSTPAARETYSGLAYVQHLDKMWLFGGALGTSGCRSTGMWMLDLPTLTWQRMDPTNGAQETIYTDINYADYDPQTKLVYVYIANNDVLAAYNPDTNTMTELLNHNSYGVGAYSNGVLDPKRHLFVILGAGFAGSYDLTTTPPTFRRFSSQTVGCSGIQGPNYPGLAYDPVQDKIVGWAGGNTVYLFDTPTLTCTAVTYPGGPPAQQTNGTYGRWRYFPALNVFALVNDWKQNAYTLRLTPAP